MQQRGGKVPITVFCARGNYAYIWCESNIACNRSTDCHRNRGGSAPPEGEGRNRVLNIVLLAFRRVNWLDSSRGERRLNCIFRKVSVGAGGPQKDWDGVEKIVV